MDHGRAAALDGNGDAVVAACIAAGTHYLDLTGETFWMQRLVREQHDAAQRARVKIIPCCGYEALPFDLATRWAAQQLREHPKEVIVSVAADGRYAINKTPLEGKHVEQVARALSEAATAGHESVIIISADAAAPHQSVVTVMEAARRVGLSQITFATHSSAQAGR